MKHITSFDRKLDNIGFFIIRLTVLIAGTTLAGGVITICIYFWMVALQKLIGVFS